jgi:hypothetical protein
MTPVFDADTRLVAWFDGKYVFDPSLAWIAFHDKGDVFSCAGGWLGPLREGTFQDRAGRPVGWLPGFTPAAGMRPSQPMNAMRPLPPKRPLGPRTPLAPMRPLAPGGGWSDLSWLQWTGKPAVADAPVDGEEGQPFQVNGNTTCFQNPSGT